MEFKVRWLENFAQRAFPDTLQKQHLCLRCPQAYKGTRLPVPEDREAQLDADMQKLGLWRLWKECTEDPKALRVASRTDIEAWQQSQTQTSWTDWVLSLFTY
jgi:hypothetical protein